MAKDQPIRRFSYNDFVVFMKRYEKEKDKNNSRKRMGEGHVNPFKYVPIRSKKVEKTLISGDNKILLNRIKTQEGSNK